MAKRARTVSDQVDNGVKDSVPTKEDNGDRFYGHAMLGITLVPWGELFFDPTFNVRNEDSYSSKQLKELDISLSTLGLLKPLDVSERPNGQKLILCGHRRYSAMSIQNDKYVSECETKGVEPTTLPWGEVPCRIHHGLSHQEEQILMLDHGHVKSLRPSELFRAVKRLRALRWTETMICEKLGFPRGKVSTHFVAAGLPLEAQTEYARYLTDRKGDGVLPMTRETVVELNTAFNSDIKKGKGGSAGYPAFDAKLEDVKSGVFVPATQRNKGVSTVIEDELAQAHRHPILGDYLRGFSSKDEDVIKIANDARENILHALQEVFPHTPTVVTEGNVTHTL